MTTISQITKRILQEKPFIHEALEKDLINIMALSELIQPEIEKELGKVKTSAISMAIRRYVEQNSINFKRFKISKRLEISVKSNLFEISLNKSDKIFQKLVKLYGIVNFELGDTLNIIQGNHQILIVSNEKYEDKFLKILKGKKIRCIVKDIASISLSIPREMVDIPGYYYVITKTMAMNNITIIDMVNTETEATFILHDKDISRAYDILKRELSVEYYKK